MKIKKFKLDLKLKDVYNRLKQSGIQLTDEVTVLIDVIKKEIDELIVPSVLFEIYDVKNEKIGNFMKNIVIYKNTTNIAFVIATLGERIDKFILDTTEHLKKVILETIVDEYLKAALVFVSKILKEKIEEDIEIGNSFLVPQEFYKEILLLLSAEKIGVYLTESNTLSPMCSNISYILLFKTKK